MRSTHWPMMGLLLLLGCESAPRAPEVRPDPKPASEGTRAATPAPPPATQIAASAPAAAESAPVGATVGQAAPAFTLPDLDGRSVSLADFAGKVVVLEWFNPGCPFVRASHTRGSLVDAARRARASGVVWLAINSGAPGQQGHGVAANRQGAEQFGLGHPVLLDEDGRVGRAYGALKTPHLFVIDERGKLVYGGAVDNSPDAEGESPEGGQLVRYVDQALSELAAGRSVSVPTTKPYGCSVKYGKAAGAPIKDSKGAP